MPLTTWMVQGKNFLLPGHPYVEASQERWTLKDTRGLPHTEGQARTSLHYYESLRPTASNGNTRSVSLALYRLRAAACHQYVT